MNNLRQIGLFMQFSTDDNRDVFPGHRNGNLTTDAELPSRTNWWGTAIVGYAKGDSNCFRWLAEGPPQGQRHHMVLEVR